MSPIIDEERLLEKLSKARRVVLLEPEYKRKYPPLGLAKIATFVKEMGGEVAFQRQYQPVGEDLICVASLFTYNSKEVISALQSVRLLSPERSVIVGGVYASLMAKHLEESSPGVEIFKGYSKILDLKAPDYLIDWGLEEPWNDYSFVFTTRGCPNKCAYCAVWRIEPDMWVNPKWKEHVDEDKPFIMVSDNNLSAQPFSHIKEVCEFAIEKKKKIVFDNGFDCKHITDELATLLARVSFRPNGMRLAFDRIEEDGVFQEAIECLLKNGVKKYSIQAYVLFNFTDTPQEANYRMRECVRLGIRPYPQKYTPLNTTDRETPYIGKRWTKTLLRAFRYFWLMAGFYTKYKFEDWVVDPRHEKFALSQEDWDAWNFGKKEEPRNEDEEEPEVIRIGGLYDKEDKSHQAGSVYDPEGLSPTLDIAGGGYREPLTIDIPKGAIRRFTPREYERLQGFPDDWTRAPAIGNDAGIRLGCEEEGEPDEIIKGDVISDSQRYKMMGNAVSVPVVEAIGKKILKTLEEV